MKPGMYKISSNWIKTQKKVHRIFHWKSTTYFSPYTKYLVWSTGFSKTNLIVWVYNAMQREKPCRVFVGVKPGLFRAKLNTICVLIAERYLYNKKKKKLAIVISQNECFLLQSVAKFPLQRGISVEKAHAKPVQRLANTNSISQSRNVYISGSISLTKRLAVH